MSHGFGKLYASAFTGSLYGVGPQVYSTLAYAIAHAQPPDGRVEINPVLVAGMIGMPVEDLESALQFLQSPDPRSRTEGEEGRRLVKTGPFEYRLVNFLKYRVFELDRAEYKRNWDRDHRPLRRNSKDRRHNTPDTPPTTPDSTPDKPHASASASASVSVPREGAGEIKSAFEAFEAFWHGYPLKKKRGDAEHAFTEVGGYEHIAEILAAIEAQRGSDSWLKEDGRFVPYPARWLRDKQWLDQINGAEIKSEEFSTPTAQRFRIASNRGYLYWTRTDGGPRREQFAKGTEQDKVFQASRLAYDCWLKECEKWEREHAH